MTDTRIEIGLDIFEKNWPEKLKGARLALLYILRL